MTVLQWRQKTGPEGGEITVLWHSDWVMYGKQVRVLAVAVSGEKISMHAVGKICGRKWGSGWSEGL